MLVKSSLIITQQRLHLALTIGWYSWTYILLWHYRLFYCHEPRRCHIYFDFYLINGHWCLYFLSLWWLPMFAIDTLSTAWVPLSLSLITASDFIFVLNTTRVISVWFFTISSWTNMSFPACSQFDRNSPILDSQAICFTRQICIYSITLPLNYTSLGEMNFSILVWCPLTFYVSLSIDYQMTLDESSSSNT